MSQLGPQRQQRRSVSGGGGGLGGSLGRGLRTNTPFSSSRGRRDSANGGLEPLRSFVIARALQQNVGSSPPSDGRCIRARY